jgi:hypothetical protein
MHDKQQKGTQSFSFNFSIGDATHFVERTLIFESLAEATLDVINAEINKTYDEVVDDSWDSFILVLTDKLDSSHD